MLLTLISATLQSAFGKLDVLGDIYRCDVPLRGGECTGNAGDRSTAVVSLFVISNWLPQNRHT